MSVKIFINIIDKINPVVATKKNFKNCCKLHFLSRLLSLNVHSLFAIKLNIIAPIKAITTDSFRENSRYVKLIKKSKKSTVVVIVPTTM